MTEKKARGAVFDIQRYSIHDGPGIRTILFLKGCPLRCPWCSNPESQKIAPELFYTKLKCIGCLSCVGTCPEQAIRAGESGILIDREKCNTCGACAKECCAGALETMGREETVESCISAVLKDKVFYDKSGGGMTLSGGEPLSQSEFAGELLKAAKEHGIHTAIETCGYAGWEDFLNVLSHTDLFLFDIKILDEQKHKEVIGTENKLILENAKKLVQSGAKLMIRVPVIPGVNDDKENLEGIVRYAKEIGALSLNFLPYHRLGESKYEKLGKEYTLAGTQIKKEAELEQLAQDLEKHGVLIQIGG